MDSSFLSKGRLGQIERRQSEFLSELLSVDVTNTVKWWATPMVTNTHSAFLPAMFSRNFAPVTLFLTLSLIELSAGLNTDFPSLS